MNKINQSLLAIAIVLGGVISAQLVSPSLSGIAQAAPTDCGCGCVTEAAPCETCDACQDCCGCSEATPCSGKRGCGCKRCRKPRKKLRCPSCTTECDTCTLELDHYEEEKTCFKTEQKIVCIPPVRYPWEKCCPPGRTSKTRTINVLKVHKYKCKACGYKWKVDPLPEPGDSEPAKDAEPVEATEPALTEAAPQPPLESNIDPVVAPVDNGVLMTPTAAPQPSFEPTLDASALDSVPKAPAATN